MNLRVRNFAVVFLATAASVVVLGAAEARGQTVSASESTSLFGSLDQHWLEAFYPNLGTGEFNEACGPVSMTNTAVYLENLYPQQFGNSLITPAGPNINYNGQQFTTADNWIYTAGGVLASPANMNTIAANGGTIDFNFLAGSYNYLEGRAPGNFEYSAMTSSSGWGNPQTPLAAPPYLGVQQGQYPTWNYLFNGLQQGWSEQVLFTFTGPYGGGHFVTLTSMSWNEQTNTGTIGFIDPEGGTLASTNINLYGGEIYTNYGGYSGNYANASIITMADTIADIVPGYNQYLGLGAGQSGSDSWNSGQYTPFSVFVGDFGTGSFIHSGGTIVVSSFLGLGVGASGSGSYTLSNGASLSAATEYIGGNGRGSFTQQGGTNTISGLNSSGGTSGLSLVLGFGISGSGSYILNAGSLSAPAEYIGYSGSGSFTQWGGANTIAGGNSFLAIGQQPGSSGTYTLNVGSLSAPAEYIGDYGSGSFTQAGGTNSVSTYFVLGLDTGGGTYRLNSGSLFAPTEYIGYSGSGIFTQTGGTHTVTSDLYLGYAAGSSGSYSLSNNGLLSAPNNQVIGNSGTGSFTQSGGNNAGFALYLGGSNQGVGFYSLSAGSLSAIEFVGYASNGYGSFTQSGGTNSSFSLDLGFLSNSSGTYTLKGGSVSATVEYIGFYGTAGFAQTGGTHAVSNTLYMGYYAGSSGTYNLQTGSLSAPFEYIGNAGNGSVVQSGGTNSVTGTLYVAQNASSSGSYTLSGNGYLSANTEAIGSGGSGGFTQSGGTNLVSGSLVVASQLSGVVGGTYILGLSGSGGYLSAPLEYVAFGNDTQGVFTQVSGTNLVTAGGTLCIGNYSNSSGTYSLQGGSLTVPNEYIGFSGNGTFTQSGGTHAVSSNLIIGNNSNSSGQYNLQTGTNTIAGLLILGNNSGGTGSYTQSGGSLSDPYGEYIGNSGIGSFTQSGGTHSSASLILGNNLGGNGTYLLEYPGQLLVQFENIGNSGSGSFTQWSGIHTVSTSLTLGANSQSSGMYSLQGGTLSAPVEFIGYEGSGNFQQSGGTNTVTAGGALWLGSYSASGGSYSLGANYGGGYLSAAVEYIGYGNTSSPSVFTQSGGTNVVGALVIGNNANTSGNYVLNLSSAASLSAGTETVGVSGNGIFYQSNGTNSVGSLVLAQSSGSSANYQFYGGLLSISSGLTHGSGSGTFTLDGGTLDMNGNSINVNTFNALSGVLRNVSGITSGGTQGLVKSQSLVSNIALYLSGTNTYAGPTTVNAGMLVAASGMSLSATSTGTVTINNGALAAGPAGGMISGQVIAGAGATIAPGGGGALYSGYGTLNLNGGLTSNANTTFLFNLKLNTSTGSTGNNGDAIYAGDLINLNHVATGGTPGIIAFVNTPTQIGDYRLFAEPNASQTLNFALPAETFQTFALSTTVDSGYIDMVVATATGTSGGTWNVNNSGTWGLNTNWTPLVVPTGGTVTFAGVPSHPTGPSTPLTVSLNGACSALGLVFNVSNGDGYTLSPGTAAGAELTLGTPSSAASITVLAGAHTISTPLVMGGNLTINAASGTSLQLAGNVSQSATGSSLTVSGGGLVVLSGVASYTGSTTISAGTLQINTGGQLPAANEYLGGSGNATLSQSGGSHFVSSALYMAYNLGDSGSYNLSGGQISAPTEYIGYSGSAGFTQTGGTNSVTGSYPTGLYIGYGSGSSGSYVLNGGLLSVTDEYLNFGSYSTSAIFLQNGGTNSVSTYLEIGRNGPATYTLNAGLIDAANETVGDGTGNPMSVFTQNGGTNLASLLYVGYNANATYNLYSPGQIVGGTVFVGNGNYGGNVNQYGGTTNVSSLIVGNNGSGYYALSGGQIVTQTETLNASGGQGNFYQNGGANTVLSALIVGNASSPYQSTYTLTGSGQLSAPTEYIGCNGSGNNVFNQTGGTNTVSTALYVGYNAGSSGSYSLSNGLLSLATGGNINEFIGYSGNGSVTQTGGTHAVSGILTLGYNASGNGTYSLQGGSLSAAAEWGGISGSGSFSQTGGTNSTGILFLGLAGGSGTYSLGGNGQLSAFYEYVAAAPVTGMNSGTGIFLQTGGTNSAGSLNLANGSGYSGTYMLNGGLLILTSLNQGGGAATFDFGGGTFRAGAAFPYPVYVPIVLSTQGSNGVFDTNGTPLTLAGPLSGPGGLQKIGAGTLTLAVSNGYTGTTLVSNGTLLLGDPNALSGSTFDTSGGGALDFGSLTSADFGGLQGSGNLVLSNANSTDVALTVGGNNADTTFSGNLSDLDGGGSLTKTGTGLLILGGDDTYGGGTTVSSGTLELASSLALLDGSSLTVGANASAILGVAAPQTAAAVPEPGTLALLAVAALWSAARAPRLRGRRRFRRRSGSATNVPKHHASS
jgi:autotransporter-associated beta strand protein